MASCDVVSEVAVELVLDVELDEAVELVEPDDAFDKSLISAVISLFNVDSVDVDELSVVPSRALVRSFTRVLMSLRTAELVVDDDVPSLVGGGGGGGMAAIPPIPSEADVVEDESPICCAWTRVPCISELIIWNAEARSLALTPSLDVDDDVDADADDEDDEESISLVRVS